MKAPERHRHEAPKKVNVSLITISSSRYSERQLKGNAKDGSGDIAERLILRSGHSVVSRALVEDNSKMIARELLRSIYKTDSDAVILIGGSGLAKRDVTIETVKPFFEKEIEGFGEILRILSYRKIGPAAILTRATAGTISGKVVFCIPGSPDAVRTAVKFILPDLPHAVHIAGS